MAQPLRAQLLRHHAGTTRWELAIRAPAPSVRPYVRDYCGYVERTDGPLRRRELPSLQAVLIFDFGPPIRLLESGDPRRASRHHSGFVAGVGDSFTMTEHDGFSQGVQVNLTAIGARLVFGVPMVHLANTTIALDDLFNAEDRGMSSRLAEAPDWDARFDLIDRFIARRVATTHAMTSTMTWAIDQIERSRGLVDIGELSRRSGYSHKHLISLFREHVGLPPRLVARLVRFDAVIRRLKAGAGATWVDLAANFGFYDQAHLVREFRHFTGCTPTETREHLGDFDEILRTSAEVNPVQDAAAGPP